MARVGMGFGDRFEEKTKGKNKTLERMFSPEFRNRLDSVVSFHALKKDSIDKVVDKFLHQLDGMLSDKRVTLELTDRARTWLGDEGFDPKFGARPMERVIQEHVKKPVSKELLFGDLEHGGRVLIDGDENGLTLKVLETFEPLPDEELEEEGTEEEEVTGEVQGDEDPKETVPV